MTTVGHGRPRWLRWLPEHPEYVAPSEWWPLIGVCGVVLGATTGGLGGALFGVPGLLVLVLSAVRWLRHQEMLRARRSDPRPWIRREADKS